jgi:plastocyanin
MTRPRTLLVSLALLAACGSARKTPPIAQPSSTAEANALVRVKTGTSFAAACVIVNAGDTVEWRNLSPRASVIVLSVREPYELSSPSLSSPYNFVLPEASDECTTREGGVCIEPLPFSYWRHTFPTPGIFDYQDQGGSAMTTVGGYSYGLPPGPQIPAASRGVGTVCVRGASQDCNQVCCTGQVGAVECAPGLSCVSNRCGGVVL